MQLNIITLKLKSEKLILIFKKIKGYRLKLIVILLYLKII